MDAVTVVVVRDRIGRVVMSRLKDWSILAVIVVLFKDDGWLYRI